MPHPRPGSVCPAAMGPRGHGCMTGRWPPCISRPNPATSDGCWPAGPSPPTPRANRSSLTTCATAPSQPPSTSSSVSPEPGGRSRSASSRPRTRSAWTSTRSGGMTPGTATSPSRCSLTPTLPSPQLTPQKPKRPGPPHTRRSPSSPGTPDQAHHPSAGLRPLLVTPPPPAPDPSPHQPLLAPLAQESRNQTVVLVRQSEIVILSSVFEACSVVVPAGAGLVASSADVPAQVMFDAVPAAGE